MTPRLLSSIAALLVLSTSTAARAEQKTVYRCGQAYQDSPCPGGKVVDVADERSPVERQAGLEAARNEAEFGSRLQRERLDQERVRHVAGAANLGTPAKPLAHAEPKHGLEPKKKKQKAAKASLRPYEPPKSPKAAQTTG